MLSGSLGSLTAASVPCFVEANVSSSALSTLAPFLHMSPMKEGRAALPALHCSPQGHGLDIVVGT